MRRTMSNGFDLDIYVDLKHSKDFIYQSLFVKKLLTKKLEICILCQC